MKFKILKKIILHFLPIHSFINLKEIYLDEEKTKSIMLGKYVKCEDSNFLLNEKLKMFNSKNNFIGIGVFTNKILKPLRLIKFIPNFS